MLNEREQMKKETRTCGPLAWEEVEGGVRIVKLLEDAVSVTVPCEIGGLPVVEVGDSCFFGKQALEEVRLPETLKKIGPHAFSMCSGLRKLELPDSVEELGSHMLRDTNGITELKLPASLKALPESVFAFCKGLQKVELNEGLKSIGPHAFWRTRVGMGEPLVLPDSVEEIAPGAFADYFGPIRIQTALPSDPFWFTDLPAPYVPGENKQPSMITPATRKAVFGLLEEAVGQLSRKTALIRWEYHWGRLSPDDVLRSVDKVYWETLQSFQVGEGLADLCKKNGLTWNDMEFRYLNEILLTSCGLGYQLKNNQVVVNLLEDAEGDPGLLGQMHRLLLHQD